MQRGPAGPEGVFSTVSNQADVQLFVVGEHAYQGTDDLWSPKVPAGVYICQRGIHQLQGGLPFDTFQVMNVPLHNGILFHKGNLPEVDSEGCLLLGTRFGVLGQSAAILESALAFQAFLNLQQGLNEFTLTINDYVGNV